MSRISGLEQEQKSFLFKMLQSILPTKERLHRIGKVQSPSCILCQDPVDTLEHLVTCQYSTAVTTPLLQFLISQDSSISPRDIITLNIKTTESMELPAVWLISTCLILVWEERILEEEQAWRHAEQNSKLKLSCLSALSGNTIPCTTVLYFWMKL